MASSCAADALCDAASAAALLPCAVRLADVEAALRKLATAPAGGGRGSGGEAAQPPAPLAPEAALASFGLTMCVTTVCALMQHGSASARAAALLQAKTVLSTLSATPGALATPGGPPGTADALRTFARLAADAASGDDAEARAAGAACLAHLAAARSSSGFALQLAACLAANEERAELDESACAALRVATTAATGAVATPTGDCVPESTSGATPLAVAFAAAAALPVDLCAADSDSDAIDALQRLLALALRRCGDGGAAPGNASVLHGALRCARRTLAAWPAPKPLPAAAAAALSSTLLSCVQSGSDATAASLAGEALAAGAHSLYSSAAARAAAAAEALRTAGGEAAPTRMLGLTLLATLACDGLAEELLCCADGFTPGSASLGAPLARERRTAAFSALQSGLEDAAAPLQSCNGAAAHDAAALEAAARARVVTIASGPPWGWGVHEGRTASVATSGAGRAFSLFSKTSNEGPDYSCALGEHTFTTGQRWRVRVRDGGLGSGILLGVDAPASFSATSEHSPRWGWSHDGSIRGSTVPGAPEPQYEPPPGVASRNPPDYHPGDVLGFSYDAAAGTLQLSKNGTPAGLVRGLQPPLNAYGSLDFAGQSLELLDTSLPTVAAAAAAATAAAEGCAAACARAAKASAEEAVVAAELAAQLVITLTQHVVKVRVPSAAARAYCDMEASAAEAAAQGVPLCALALEELAPLAAPLPTSSAAAGGAAVAVCHAIRGAMRALDTAARELAIDAEEGDVGDGTIVDTIAVFATLHGRLAAALCGAAATAIAPPRPAAWFALGSGLLNDQHDFPQLPPKIAALDEAALAAAASELAELAAEGAPLLAAADALPLPPLLPRGSVGWLAARAAAAAMAHATGPPPAALNALRQEAHAAVRLAAQAAAAAAEDAARAASDDGADAAAIAAARAEAEASAAGQLAHNAAVLRALRLQPLACSVADCRAVLLGPRVDAASLPAALGAAAATALAATDGLRTLDRSEWRPELHAAMLTAFAARVTPAALAALQPAARRALFFASAGAIVARLGIDDDDVDNVADNAAAVAGAAVLCVSLSGDAADECAAVAADALTPLLSATAATTDHCGSGTGACAAAEVITAALARASDIADAEPTAALRAALALLLAPPSAPAPSPAKLWLVMLHDGGTGGNPETLCALDNEEGIVQLGRNKRGLVELPNDDNMSRCHAELQLARDATGDMVWHARDVGSTNGTTMHVRGAVTRLGTDFVPFPPLAVLQMGDTFLSLRRHWSSDVRMKHCWGFAPVHKRVAKPEALEPSDDDDQSEVGPSAVRPALWPLRALEAGGRVAHSWLAASPEWRRALQARVDAASQPSREPAADAEAVLCVSLLRGMMAAGASADVAAPLMRSVAALGPERHLERGGQDAADAAVAVAAAAAASGSARLVNAWNPKDCASTLTLSEENTAVTDTVGKRPANDAPSRTSNCNGLVRARRGFTRGTHYWTVTLRGYTTSGAGFHSVGVASAAVPRTGGSGVQDASRLLGYHPQAWGLHTRNYELLHAGASASIEAPRGASEGDVLGFLVDCDAGTLSCFLNGARLGRGPMSYDALRRPSAPLFPALEMGCLSSRNVAVADFLAVPPVAAGAATRAAVAATRAAERAAGGGAAAALARAGAALAPRAAAARALAAAPPAAGVAEQLGTALQALSSAIRTPHSAGPPAAMWAPHLAILGGAGDVTLAPRAAAAAAALLRRADATAPLLAAAAAALQPQAARDSASETGDDDEDAALARCRAAALRARLAKTVYELSADAEFAAAAAASPAFGALLSAAGAASDLLQNAHSTTTLGELAARAAALAPLAGSSPGNQALLAAAASAAPPPAAATCTWVSQHAHWLRSGARHGNAVRCDVCRADLMPAGVAASCLECRFDICRPCLDAGTRVSAERDAAAAALLAAVQPGVSAAAPISAAIALSAASDAQLPPPAASPSAAAVISIAEAELGGAAVPASLPTPTFRGAMSDAAAPQGMPSVREARVLLRAAEEACAAGFARRALFRIICTASGAAAASEVLTARAFAAAAAAEPTQCGASEALAAWRGVLTPEQRAALGSQLAQVAAALVPSSDAASASASHMSLRTAFGIAVTSLHGAACSALTRRLHAPGAAALVVVRDDDASAALPAGAALRFFSGATPAGNVALRSTIDADSLRVGDRVVAVDRDDDHLPDGTVGTVRSHDTGAFERRPFQVLLPDARVVGYRREQLARAPDPPGGRLLLPAHAEHAMGWTADREHWRRMRDFSFGGAPNHTCNAGCMRNCGPQGGAFWRCVAGCDFDCCPSCGAEARRMTVAAAALAAFGEGGAAWNAAAPLVVPGDAVWWRADVTSTAEAAAVVPYAFTVWVLYRDDAAGAAAAAAPRLLLRSGVAASPDGEDARVGDGGEAWRLLDACGEPWHGALRMTRAECYWGADKKWQPAGAPPVVLGGATAAADAAGGKMVEEGSRPFLVRLGGVHQAAQGSIGAAWRPWRVALSARPPARTAAAPSFTPKPPSVGMHFDLPAAAGDGAFVLLNQPYEGATTWAELQLPGDAFPGVPRSRLVLLAGALQLLPGAPPLDDSDAAFESAAGVDGGRFLVAGVAPLDIALAGGGAGGVAWRAQPGEAFGFGGDALCWRLDGQPTQPPASCTAPRMLRKFAAVFVAPGGDAMPTDRPACAASLAAWLAGELVAPASAWALLPHDMAALYRTLAAALAAPGALAAGSRVATPLMRAAQVACWADAPPDAAAAAAAAVAATAAAAAATELAQPGDAPPSAALQVSRRTAALLECGAVLAREPLADDMRCPAPAALPRLRQLAECLAAFEKRAPAPSWLAAPGGSSAAAVGGRSNFAPEAPELGIFFALPMTITTGMRLLYDRPYRHATRLRHLRLPAGCADTHVLVAAAPPGSDMFELCAVGRVDAVFRRTSERDQAVSDGGDGVYWYCVPGHSFGFTPIAEIELDSGDAADEEGDSRLSWHLTVDDDEEGEDNLSVASEDSDDEDDGNGGYRCGSLVDASDLGYRKYIFSFTPGAEDVAAAAEALDVPGELPGAANDDLADNARWSSELDAQLVRLAVATVEAAAAAAAVAAAAARAGGQPPPPRQPSNAASLRAAKPEALFPRAPISSELRAVESVRLPAPRDAPLEPTKSADAAAQQEPLPPLAARRPEALAARFKLLQRFNALAADCLHLLHFPANGDDEDADDACSEQSLGSRLLATAARLFPEVACTLLLRSSEQALAAVVPPGASDGAMTAATSALRPAVNIDRTAATEAVLRGGPGDAALTVFGQLFKQLESHAPRWAALGAGPSQYQDHGKMWHVRALVGEDAIDAGGPFRVTLRAAAAELCPEAPPLPSATGAAAEAARARARNVLKLFTPSPNSSCPRGAEYTDAFMPRSGPLDDLAARQLRFVGSLLGAAWRSGNVMEMTLPPLLWKLLLRQRATLHDLASADIVEAARIADLARIVREADWPRALTWSRVDGRGRRVPLVPMQPRTARVAFAQRDAYCDAALAGALAAFGPGVEALRSGLEVVIPRAALAPLPWRTLAAGCTGSPRVTCAGLRAAARSSIRSSDAKYERWLWDALEAGSDADRAAFLAFATGRSRLPVSVRAATAGGGGGGRDEPVLLLDIDGESSETRFRLPTSSTCSYTFHLARAPSAEALRERLLRAIYECTSIDRDRAGAGGDARHPIEAAVGDLPPPEEGGAVEEDDDDGDDSGDAGAGDGPEYVPLFRVPLVRAEDEAAAGVDSDAEEEANEDEDESDNE